MIQEGLVPRRYLSRNGAMKKMKFRVTALLTAILIVGTSTAYATDRFVDPVAGSDANVGAGCIASGGAACKTIAAAIGVADPGDTIKLAAGTYVPAAVITIAKKLITIQGPGFGTSPSGRTLGGAGEAIIDASALPYAFEIKEDNVTIEGLDIKGGASTWTGISVFGGYDLWTIQKNFIHGMTLSNPGSSILEVSHAIHALGGGTSGARLDISGVNIFDNEISAIGGANQGGFNVSAGTGIYISSITGTDVTKCALVTMAQCGAWIHGNVIFGLKVGKNTVKQGPPVNDATGKEPTAGIVVLQDDDPDRFNKSVLIEGNTYVGVSGTEKLDNAVFIDIGDSKVVEDNSIAGTFVDVTSYVVNKDRKATIDEVKLAPFFKTLDVNVFGPGTDGYFEFDADAKANSPSTSTIVSLTPTTATTLAVEERGTTGSIKLSRDTAGDFNVREGAKLVYDGSTLTTMTLTGTSGNDLLTVDFNNGNPMPASVSYTGGAGFDKIVMRGTVQEAGDETITMTGPADGTIVFDNTGTGNFGFTTTLTFAGLEPIDDLVTVNGTYTINATSTVKNEINIIDGPKLFATQTFQVNSGATPSFELVNFANKKTVKIKGSDTKDDTFTVFTTDGSPAPLILSLELIGNASGVAGTPDYFVVRPSKDFPITVTGTATGADGDFLFIDCANTGIAPCPIPVIPTGSFTPAGFKTVTFSEIENTGASYVGLNDLEITKAITDFPAGAHPGDDVTYLITVTNKTGGAIATPIYVTDVIDHRLSLVETTVLASVGTLIEKNTWSIPSLAAGASATLTYKAIVNTALTPDIVNYASILNPNDVDGNNTAFATLKMLDIFRFPLKAPIQATLFFQTSAGPRYIVGLKGGAVDPRFPGAVLCRVPDTNPTAGWDGALGNQWYSCHNGLPSKGGIPSPLEVTDLFQDSAGRIWLTTWGFDGLYFSDNGGKSWTSATPDLTGGPGGLPDGIADGWAQIYAITEDITGTLFISANNGDFYRSFDRGVTWKKGAQLPLGSADTPTSLEADPTFPGKVYAGTFGDTLYVTPGNFGETWIKPTGTGIGAGAGVIFDIEFDPISGEIFIGTAKGVYHSADGGNTWAGLNFSFPFPTNPPEIRHLTFDATGRLFVATWGFGVWKSDNWQATSLAQFALKNSNVMDLAVLPDGTLFVATDEPNTFTYTATSIATGVEDEIVGDELPSEFQLSQNYPNPFNPTTNIEFALPQTAQVRLAVYDLLGRRVALLVDGSLTAGQHRVSFEASNLPSGMYLYRLSTPTGAVTKKMVLLK